ncbi:hypothetical protein TVAG_026670 [Trichomonas vaginalis G3]|uniref:Uncharacterized protein n=1 Tax=Trichomonas vaginalis (strain ATCC PRA-98 / G3) TaxID=412133 RepID=A2DZ70_TRIV3|nr:armadillo (ARM) repeat-containing protein family [Trichomonas vaginalis G3]EAY14346.1 hypothetical protein TVAG_026670 [Trichomonas vaginalis G3]KAI5517371.1 armadillo (ARM) repeat-containing protein family [Trichomonas vaginalis G3]|eukprot:XP_001326569.1 hypothetical protein [Trichomonas vaginalis G3]
MKSSEFAKEKEEEINENPMDPSLCEAINTAVSVIESNDYSDEIYPLFLDICNVLDKPETYGMCRYLLEIYKNTQNTQAITTLEQISKLDAFPISEFANSSSVQDLIDISVNVTSEASPFAISIIDSILAKTQERNYLAETSLFQSLILFSANYELSSFLVHLLNTTVDLPPEIANFSSPILEFIDSTDENQQINGLICLTLLYQHGIHLDLQYIHRCFDKFAGACSSTILYWLIKLLGFLPNIPLELIEQFLNLLPNETLQEQIIYVLYKNIDDVEINVLINIINEILNHLDEMVYKTRGYAIEILAILVDRTLYVSIEIFQYFIVYLESCPENKNVLHGLLKMFISPLADEQSKAQMFEICKEYKSVFEEIVGLADEDISNAANIILSFIDPD